MTSTYRVIGVCCMSLLWAACEREIGLGDLGGVDASFDEGSTGTGVSSGAGGAAGVSSTGAGPGGASSGTGPGGASSGMGGSGTGGNAAAGTGGAGRGGDSGSSGAAKDAAIADSSPEAGGSSDDVTAADAYDVRLPPMDAACAGEAFRAERRPNDLYIMVDSSGSMEMLDVGQTLSRWDNLTRAITTFVNDPVTAGMMLGLDFFPEGQPGSCNVADYTMANVGIDVVSSSNNAHANAIVAAMQGRARAGGTPTTPALSGALQAGKAWQMARPDRTLSVLFLTDGQPTGCAGGTNTVDGAAAVARMYATGMPSMKTYVLGIGPDTGNLDAIAAAGDTTMAYTVPSGGAAELAEVLATIRKSANICEYNVPRPEGGTLDATMVNIQTRVGPTAPFTDLYSVGNAAGCTDVVTNASGQGWYYDNPSFPWKMTLCPNSCAPLQATDGSDVIVLLGCKTKGIPPTGPCISGTYWTGGNTPSPLMTPGRPCLGSGCHTPTSNTPFTMAGTVYPREGLREPNDCSGIDGAGAAIAVLDDIGQEIIPRLQINAAGSFFTNKALPPSYRVKVISMGREAVMQTPVSDGNCNYCHTTNDFMGAQGRIVPTAP